MVTHKEVKHMKIVDKRRSTNIETNFEDLFIGDVFEYNDRFYMKIQNYQESNNSIAFPNGRDSTFSGLTLVTLLKNAELHIKD